MPRPVTTSGTIIGEISTAISNPLPRNCTRCRPAAASVPRTVASRVAAGATMKLLAAARPQSSDVNRASYQRSENDLIG